MTRHIKPHKNPRYDLRKRYPLYIEIGLVASLVVLILAFNVSLPKGDKFEVVLDEQEVVQIEDIAQTEQIEKPPPPPRPQVPVEVPNDEILEDEDFEIPDLQEIAETTERPPPPPEPKPETVEEAEPEIFMIVEQMPCMKNNAGECNLALGYPEQNNAGLIDLQRKISYPEIAKKAGVEGRVTVQFVVDEQGLVRDPVVLRGIGAGCDEEALKAVSSARFIPGMQRNKPVRVRMSLPISFKLR